jgi:mannose-6-phosphate isomerase-like protein (cupin superfamily)
VKNLWKRGLAALGAIAISAAGMTQAHAQAKAWTPKPTPLAPYVNGMKPLTKLSEVLADKEPSVSWRHKVVDDQSVKAAWVGLKPGDAMRQKLVADHRTAFVVWDGQIEVNIPGNTPATFTATKGMMVQVPLRRPYSLTNVGSTPSLHFEVHNAKRVFIYPQPTSTAGLPPPPQGYVWFPHRYEQPDSFTSQGTPVSRDFLADPAGSTGAFVNDDRLFMNVIRGALSPVTDDHYFKVSGGDAWFVMEGQMGFSVEGLNSIVANPGDIVYIPEGRFHQASHQGASFSTGININGYRFGSGRHWQETQPPVPPIN